MGAILGRRLSEGKLALLAACKLSAVTDGSCPNDMAAVVDSH
jgi:hypothetical protein